MRILLFVFTYLLSLSSFARFDVEYSRTGSETNYSNILSLGYSLNTYVDEETEEVGLNHYIGYVYSDGLSVTNLNANLSDFEILSKSHELSYSMTFSEAFTLSLSGGLTQLNGAEARADSLGAGLYYQFEKIQIGFDYTETLYKQLKQATILTVDVTANAKFKQKMQSLYFDYQWTESFLVKLNLAGYSYQTFGSVTDMDDFTNKATIVGFLNTGGPSIADQAYAQIKNSADLGFLYNFSDNWLLEIGLQSSTDQLAPNSKTNGASLGLEYTNSINTINYTITGSVTGSKTENLDGSSYTGLLGLGFSF
jgi:hypothetical protein